MATSAKRHFCCISATSSESVRVTHQPHSYSNDPDRTTGEKPFPPRHPLPLPGNIKDPHQHSTCNAGTTRGRSTIDHSDRQPQCNIRSLTHSTPPEGPKRNRRYPVSGLNYSRSSLEHRAWICGHNLDRLGTKQTRNERFSWRIDT